MPDPGASPGAAGHSPRAGAMVQDEAEQHGATAVVAAASTANSRPAK